MVRLPTLYNKRADGRTQEWTIEIDGPRYRTVFGLENGRKIIGAWTVVSGKNVGHSNATTPEQQALREAQALWRKKHDSGYAETLESANTPFEPMLPYQWSDYSCSITYPVYCQPKLDGIRCIAKRDGLFSRNGKRFLSVPHIYAAIEPMFNRVPGLTLDGELYADRLANDFNRICSLVKKVKPTASELEESAATIKYWVYDVPSEKPFRERLIDLKLLLARASEHLVEVPTYLCHNSAELDLYYEHFLDDGYEGQIIRINGPYEHKRSKYLLKRKEFQDAEYRILDIVEGTGTRTGAVGYCVMDLGDGRTFRSNVKGTLKFLTDMLANRSFLIGKLATVKFHKLTPDGIPRFPYIIAIRDYE